ncbi:hypothetical protein N0V94_003567 [Neodidymelliopsis sp. IMI 364377]|nr:hypothetical protein N0V94_003567 [Neodidymelliopsis sp. IMI 364377]
MSTKPQSPGPNPTSTTSAKQPRSRKAANTDQMSAGRAGSAGGVMLDKEHAKKVNPPSSSTASKPAQASKDIPPKRKPRKLNKEPTSTSTATAPATTPIEAAAELEALKSRVRGLEAKVEELYKSTPSPANTSTRSPRRRGKGRKNSSSATTATLGNLAKDRQEQSTPLPNEGEQEEEEADEELSRLEGELEVARQDLARYRPSPRRTTTSDSIEEIPRDGPATTTDANRQVTLSGSYRIPLPATLNPEDVKTIQSGVSAAQNVARSFLDQRRANQALRNAQAETPPPPSSQPAAPSAKGSSKPKARAPAAQASTELTTQLDNGAGGKQSWGEWIGGYSLAISRAVKTIEHEAAMEAQQQQQQQQTRPASSSKAGPSGTKKKRPGVKSKLSGEQVQGLMG